MRERLDAVLTVIYLIFNEGYAATEGEPLVRTDLCAEAIRLGRLVRALMAPRPPAEATGLLALMLLHDARRDARLDDAGDLVVLEEQDRSRWNQKQIAEALPLVEEALRAVPARSRCRRQSRRCIAERRAPKRPTGPRSCGFTSVLERLQPSPIVSLNRAVAVAMGDGPAAALAIIDGISAEGELDNYHLFHAARADLLRRLGSSEEATRAYERALTLVTNDSERRFLQRRLREVQSLTA